MGAQPPTPVDGATQAPEPLDSLALQGHPQRGFFGPASLAWRLSREPALKLAGMPALLMQIAHPKVAQGVADHSQFHAGPLRRVARTFASVHAIMFGTRDEALRAASRLRAMHTHVRGERRVPGTGGAVQSYAARDPELLLWVAATLLDLSVTAYELFVECLSPAQKERYYQEGKMFGRLCGVPEAMYPATWVDLQRWMHARIEDKTLTVTPAAREVCRSLLWGSWSTRLLAPVNYAMSAMLLPEPIRDAYGFRRTRTVRAGFWILVNTTRLLVRGLPRRWRGLPQARRRERALARSPNG